MDKWSGASLPSCTQVTADCHLNLITQPGDTSSSASKQLRLSLSSAGITLAKPTVEVLTLYQPRIHICVMSSHKAIRMYMGV